MTLATKLAALRKLHSVAERNVRKSGYFEFLTGLNDGQLRTIARAAPGLGRNAVLAEFERRQMLKSLAAFGVSDAQ